MWDTRDGTVTRDLLTGINGVWQVVFDRRFCIAASNRQDSTFLEVWDFAGDKGSNDEEEDEDELGGDEDDNNSETSDPYDELRLAEGDIEDSESDDDGAGDVFYDPDDSDFNMDSTSARSGTYNSPTPSHSTLGGGRKNVGGRGRRSVAPTSLDKMSLDSPAEAVTTVSSSSHTGVSNYPLVWGTHHGVGPSSATHTTTTTTTTTSSSTSAPGRLHDWTSFGIPSGSASSSSGSRGGTTGAGSSSTRTPTHGRSQGRRE